MVLRRSLRIAYRPGNCKLEITCLAFQPTKLVFSLVSDRLFLIEGAPSIVLAVFAGWYLPNDPETAKFLTEEERRVAVGRLAKGNV